MSVQGLPPAHIASVHYHGAQVPLHFAIIQEDLEMVDVLLSYGADPHAHRDIDVSWDE